MDAVSGIQNADSMKFSISGRMTYFGADALGPPANFSVKDICLSKTAGSLAFALNLKSGALGADFEALDLDVHFVGTWLGTDSSGRDLIQWRANESIDQVLPRLNNAIIDNVEGLLTTAVSVLPRPALAEDIMCAGGCRAYMVEFTTSGEGNTVAVKWHHDDFGLRRGALFFDNLEFGGIAAIPVRISLTINQATDECGIGAVQGNPQHQFRVHVGGAPSGIELTYKWSAIGATPIGPNDRDWVDISMPQAPPYDFVLSVDVAMGTCMRSAKVEVEPIPKDLADKIEDICHLVMNNTLLNEHWDPLGPDDPRRPQLGAGSALRFYNMLVGLYSLGHQHGRQEKQG